MTTSLHKLIAAVAVTTAAASCGITGSRGNGDDNYFSAFTAFPRGEWEYASPSKFRVDTLRDSISRGGTLLLSMRHTSGYEYGNIWLELSYPVNDSTVRADTFNIVLADDYGHWLGRGLGPSVQVTDTLSRNFTIRKGETITLRHIMRTDTLSDIEQVGIVFLPDNQ